MNILNSVFLPFEAKEIVGIPLSVRLPDDKQVWVLVLMEVTCVSSREGFGQSKLLIRLDISHGEQLMTSCQQRKILLQRRYWWIVDVRNVVFLQNLFTI